MKIYPWLFSIVPLVAVVSIVFSSQTLAQERVQPPVNDSADRKDVEEKVLLVLQEQTEAWNRGDLDAFMATYWKSPNLTFSSGGKTTRGWQATLDRYKQRYSTREKMGQLRFDNAEVQRLADDVALVLGTWHLSLKDDSPEGNFSLVLKSFEGRWRIVHDHTSSLEK